MSSVEKIKRSVGTEIWTGKVNNVLKTEGYEYHRLSLNI